MKNNLKINSKKLAWCDKTFYLCIVNKTQTQKTFTMTKQLTPEMKAALGQFRDRVTARFEAQIAEGKSMGKSYINSKSFFFGVVADYFTNMGVGLQRKCLKDSLEMMIQLNKAIVKAEFAIAAPERKANARMFNGNYATRYGA